MAFSWKKLGGAKRALIVRGAVVMVAYDVIWGAVVYWADKGHLAGKDLLVPAGLATLPVVALIWVMARYLGEETDEFHRRMVVRILLWGTAAVMTSVCFHGLLQLLGWRGRWPAAVEWVLFLAAALVAKLTYKVQNRVPDDVDALLERGEAR